MNEIDRLPNFEPSIPKPASAEPVPTATSSLVAVTPASTVDEPTTTSAPASSSRSVPGRWLAGVLAISLSGAA